MVARERPVPACGTIGDQLDPRTQRTARPLLVHHQLHRFTDRVRCHGPEPGQHGPGNPSNVPAAHRRPPHRDQQHAQEHQSALGSHLQRRAKPRRCARRRPDDRSVPGHRNSVGNLHGPGPAQPARREPGDRRRDRCQDADRSQQSTSPAGRSCYSFHGVDRRNESSRKPEPNGKRAPPTIVRVDHSADNTGTDFADSRSCRAVPVVQPVAASNKQAATARGSRLHRSAGTPRSCRTPIRKQPEPASELLECR